MARIAVVAFSGGLDTSCIVSWLKEDWYGFDEVVAVLVDVGQEFDVEASIERGRAAGADDVVLVDRKAAFADEQCARAIKTNALYEGKYPLVSALSRPVIAQAVAELAVELGAEAVVHGCTGKGNDQLRFELSFKATDPGLNVIAPLRDRIWTRDEEIEYALANGIPVVATQASPFSIDENLLGRAIEAGALEDPWAAPPEEPYALTADPATAPEPVEVTVSFEAGIPVALDGEELPLADLIAQLNALAGPYGIGRIDMIENRAVGIKSREVYEAPAAIVLIQAHSALEDVVLTKDEARIKRGLEQRWTELVYEGLWFSPAREAIDAFVDRTQELVTGDVRIELRPNAAVVTGRRSPHMLYAETLASYGTGETFPHAAAEGFIKISSLEVELAAARAGEDRSMTLWGGRVGRPLDPAVSAFLRADDTELLPYDCQATAIHARRLHAAGLLDDAELADAEARLVEIAADAGHLRPEDEDVHSAIERLLGEVGRKIHAGRSRNDQVAAAFRLYVVDAGAEARTGIATLAGAVLDRAEAEAETPMPGYTHLQRAQPVTVGHHLLAWVEMLERDLRRFAAAAEAASESPLGAGALAGSTLDLPAPERQLRNSLDAVADRDFALDYLYAAAMCFVHLSRIGEELVLWTTAEFGFASLPEDVATGSSMMPQKLNPDVAELVRGKAGTAIGRLTGLLATVKGLPLAYNRDLQEDKPPVFAARADLRLALAALTALVRGLELDRGQLAAAASDPLLLATDAAEALVRAGVPFRDAHEQVASAVRDGTFSASEPAPRFAPGPGAVRSAIAAARKRVEAV